MKKKLVFSFDNTNLKSGDNLLIAEELILELSKKKYENLKYKMFYSSSFIKKNVLKILMMLQRFIKIFSKIYI